MTNTTTKTATRDNSPVPSDLLGAERGLKGAAIFTVISGLFFASASTSATDRLMRLFLDIVFLRVGDGPAQLTDSHHLVDAIMGGVMVGWGVMTWLLVDRFLQVSAADVKFIVQMAVVAWFVIDSAGSIASGGWINVVLNVAYAALFLLPLRKL